MTTHFYLYGFIILKSMITMGWMGREPNSFIKGVYTN
jgi:hypothetical protein